MIPHTASGLRAFFQGLHLPLTAAGFLLRRPRLWVLVAIPLVLNTLIFVALIGWGFSEFAEALNGWLEGLDAWYWTVLLWAARILFWVIVLVVVYFIFTPVALIVAAPFNDRLAESVERAYGFQIEDDRPLVKMVLGEAAYALVSEVKRMVVFLIILVLLLALNFVPMIGPVLYAGVSFAFACWFAALEFTSFAADRRHLELRRKWGLLWRKLPLTTGFGLVTVALLMIPFLNVIMVSMSAVGGTLLFGRIWVDSPEQASADT